MKNFLVITLLGLFVLAFMPLQQSQATACSNENTELLTITADLGISIPVQEVTESTNTLGLTQGDLSEAFQFTIYENERNLRLEADVLRLETGDGRPENENLEISYLNQEKENWRLDPEELRAYIYTIDDTVFELGVPIEVPDLLVQTNIPKVHYAGIGNLFGGAGDGDSWNGIVNIILLIVSLVLGGKWATGKATALKEGTKYNNKLLTAQRLFAAVMDAIKDDNKIDANEKARIESLFNELIVKPEKPEKQ